jgi:activator of HSP90 ATPase
MAAKKKRTKPARTSAKKAPPKKKTPARKPAKRKVAAKRAPKKASRAHTQTTKAVVELATIVQEQIFDAAPMDVYEALVDPSRHAAFTGSTATGEPIEGGAFTAWDGYIAGRHERLVPGARIVQRWRTTEFPQAHPDSRLELELRPEAEGKTRLRMTHSGVPKSQAKSYEKGWVDQYWVPLRVYLSNDDAW